MGKFFTELGVNLENCESMLAVQILGMSSFMRINKADYEKAMGTKYKTVKEMGKFVQKEISSKYYV